MKRIRIVELILVSLSLFGCGVTDGVAPTSRKRVFVTSTSQTGNFGGVTGGDAYCATRAAAANLGGNWKAWLSDSNNDAITRLNDVGPWYLIDQVTLVFTNKAAIPSFPLSAINQSELQTVINAFVATGTLSTGLRDAANNCLNWTDGTGGSNARVGSSNLLTASWTANTTGVCSGPARLYCFEQ